MNQSSCIFEIIHATASQPDRKLSISRLCDLGGVSRSGYYAWVKAAAVRQAREQQDRQDFETILLAYRKRGYSKGAKGIHMTLLHMDPPVVMNPKKIRRLMHKYHLSCPIRKANPYRRMAKALRTSHTALNLVDREFTQYGPRSVLLTDITYLPYAETFAYLSTILDACTRQILSYVVSPSLEVDFVLETVRHLIQEHGVSLNQQTLVHSDQGCHYTSYRFRQLLHDQKLRRSMSRRGNCWDNAPQESFFGHMKDHIRTKLKQCETFAEVSALVDDYMDYYNNERYQWELAKLSPNEFYHFCMTGSYPLAIGSKPDIPRFQKRETDQTEL